MAIARVASMASQGLVDATSLSPHAASALAKLPDHRQKLILSSRSYVERRVTKDQLHLVVHSPIAKLMLRALGCSDDADSLVFENERQLCSPAFVLPC